MLNNDKSSYIWREEDGNDFIDMDSWIVFTGDCGEESTRNLVGTTGGREEVLGESFLHLPYVEIFQSTLKKLKSMSGDEKFP